MPDSAAERCFWLLLVHSIPPKPEYLRVKVARRLARVGAVPIKNSVYVLPLNDEALEDFQWVLQEVVDGGGDCSVCEAAFVGGLSDERVVRLFHEARDRDYAAIEREATRLRAQLDETARVDAGRRAQITNELGKLRRRCDAVAEIDFFQAQGRAAAAAAMERVEEALSVRGPDREGASVSRVTSGLRRRTWVTRRGIKVDRIASAWLIRRFIDPEAEFRFVDPAGFQPEPGELRFDMFEAEYGHEGSRCTFETLVHRFELADPALSALGEIVHDIDLKERTFAREETPGMSRLIDGLVARHADDEARLRHGSIVLDTFYAGLQPSPRR